MDEIENQNNIAEVPEAPQAPETAPVQTDVPFLEAFLFHFGEPIAVAKIARGLNLSEKKCREAIEALRTKLTNDTTSAFCIIETNDEIQLATKPEFQGALKSIIEEEWKTELTPAAQETLTIVAYLGPISKMMVDYIRGVNSGFILRNLLMRGLVERGPSAERKNSFDYRVSFDFLRHMGISRAEDLPEYEKYRALLDEFNVEPEEKIEASPVILAPQE
jgi:segregation and condensation protein B